MTAGIRQIRPSDYWPVISVIDDWWGGRHMADKLPRLFFDHFTGTSFAAERDGELAGFLVGFVSQSHPAEAYIHFVGIHPDERGHGLGRPRIGRQRRSRRAMIALTDCLLASDVWKRRKRVTIVP